MSDYFSWDNVKRGYNHLCEEIDQATESAKHKLSEEWSSWTGSGQKSGSSEPEHKTEKAQGQDKVSPVQQLDAKVGLSTPVMPAPDKNGVLTISADSQNFQKAIEQPNITKLVIDQPGNVNFQIGLTTDVNHKPIFVGQIYEQGGKVDKTFALPGNVDYVTINQHNKAADGKTDVVTSFTEVAGQGRLQAYKQALNDNRFYPGTFELKPVALVPHTYPIPLTAGTNDAFELMKNSARMNDDLLDLGQRQFRHDQNVPENSKDPWFKLTLAKLDVLSAGRNVDDCATLAGTDRDNIASNAYQFLDRADQEYKDAMAIARTHLDDRTRRAQDPIYGVDPRNYHEIPRTQSGALDWNNPQANVIYYGNALDVANFEQRQAQSAKANVKTASRFLCEEGLDRLLH